VALGHRIAPAASAPTGSDPLRDRSGWARRLTAGREGGGLEAARRASAWAGVVPFLGYALVFLGIPTIAIAVGAFQGAGGGFTLANLHQAVHGVYLHGFEYSLELSALASVIPGLAGFLVAYAVHSAPAGSALRRVVVTASGVFAQFGGVPLAFLFIASLGTTGMVTRWFSDAGLNPYSHGFNLYGFGGVALVYMYFQVPLMVLVVLPALEALRPNWRDAACGLGAGRRQYWRHVAGPILLPSFLGSVLLLFGSAFSAYATAEALTSGTIPLTSIQIASFLNGNVLAGQQNVGKALGLGMVLIVALVMFLYALLQRRTGRWLR